MSGQPSHPGVVRQYVNGFHGVGELAHVGQVAQIELSDFNISGHLSGGLLGLGYIAAGDQHAVARCGQMPGAAFPMPLLPPVAVDFRHGPIFTGRRPSRWQ